MAVQSFTHIDGVAFPNPKPLEDAVLGRATCSGIFYHYEPGNGTRYDIWLTKKNIHSPNSMFVETGNPKYAAIITNFGRPAMLTWTYPLVDSDIWEMSHQSGISPVDVFVLLPLLRAFSEG